MYSDAWESWCSMIYHDSQVIRVKLVTSHSAGPKVEGAQWPAWQPDTDDAWPGAGSNGWFDRNATGSRTHRPFLASLVGYGSKSFANLGLWKPQVSMILIHVPFQRYPRDFCCFYIYLICFWMVKSHLSPIQCLESSGGCGGSYLCELGQEQRGLITWSTFTREGLNFGSSSCGRLDQILCRYYD